MRQARHPGLEGEPVGGGEVRRRAGRVAGGVQHPAALDGEPGPGVRGRPSSPDELDSPSRIRRGRLEVAGQAGRARLLGAEHGGLPGVVAASARQPEPFGRRGRVGEVPGVEDALLEVARPMIRTAQSSTGSRRRPVSSIGKRSAFCRSMAAPTRPANSGCGRVGRERSSGCAWVET